MPWGDGDGCGDCGVVGGGDGGDNSGGGVDGDSNYGGEGSNKYSFV